MKASIKAKKKRTNVLYFEKQAAQNQEMPKEMKEFDRLQKS